MTMNRFDKVIWRINGVIFLCIGVVGAGMLTLAAYELGRDIFRERHVNSLINIREEEETLFLGAFTPVDGRDIYISELRADQTYDRSYFSKSASSVRNYLFFDPSDGSSHWLLDSNDRLIVRKHEVVRNPDDCDDRIVNAFYFEIAGKDTNQDGLLNRKDRESVLLCRYDGKNAVTVIENTDIILGIGRVDSIRSVIFHVIDEKHYALTVNNRTGEVIKQSDLPFPKIP